MAGKLLITPYNGSTTPGQDPNIKFQGTGNSSDITLRITSDGSLSFEGTAGQLFSINNSLSGTLFSVNDVSGIPSIEVIDTGLVKLAEYNGQVKLGGTGNTYSGPKLNVVNGDSSYAQFGPNSSWGGILRVGATSTVSGSAIAQVISTDGNLHLDSGTANTIYLQYFTNRPTYVSGHMMQKSGYYLYPGSSSGLTDYQGNYYISSNASYGLYTNTSLKAEGSLISATDVRGPLFYDLDNTGYYLNPNGASNFGGPVTITGNGSYVGNNGYSTLILQDAGGYAGLNFRSGNSNWLIRMEAGTSEINWKYSSDASAQGVGTYSNILTVNTDFLHHYSDMRSPIFYDSDNTNYYSDPSSISVFNDVRLCGGNTQIVGGSPNQNTKWRSLGTAGSLGISFYDSNDTWMAQFYATPGNYGFLNGNWAGWDIQKATSGNLFLNNQTTYYIGTNEIYYNRVYGATDIRTPILYDNNNTGYYCDPLSTSRLNVIYCGDVYNDQGGWFRSYGATGLYSQSYANHWYCDEAAWWNCTSAGGAGGIRFRTGHAGTVRGYVYADTSSNIGFLNLNGSWRLQIVGGDYLVANGSSCRASLFYDLDNTGYYLDPASSSNIVSMSMSGNLSFSNYGLGVVGVYSSTIYQNVFSMGAAYVPASDGTSLANMYGIAWTHSNVGGQSIAGNGHQALFVQAGSTTSSIGTNVWTSGNVTAYSDARVKTNIKKIDNALNKVLQLNGYTFDRTDVKLDENGESIVPRRQTGVIAQEVLKVLPEAVTGSEEQHYSVAYGNMIGLLIEAVKEQNQKICELDKMILLMKEHK